MIRRRAPERAGALERIVSLIGAVVLGIKNSTLGILIAVTVIGSERMAVPAAVYGVLMYLSAMGVVTFGRRRLTPVAARAGRTLDGPGEG